MITRRYKRCYQNLINRKQLITAWNLNVINVITCWDTKIINKEDELLFRKLLPTYVEALIYKRVDDIFILKKHQTMSDFITLLVLPLS